VTDYISGFIVRKVANKINCDICKTFLIDNSNNSILIKLKDRNNALVKPSKDVLYICKVIEKNIKCKDLKYIFSKNFMNKIYLETKKEVYGLYSVGWIITLVASHCLLIIGINC